MPSVRRVYLEESQLGESLDPPLSTDEPVSVQFVGPGAAVLLKMMSREEAAEEILRGHPWLQCETCQARGEIWIHDECIECDRCGGEGYLPRCEYASACVILDKKMPRKPWTHRRMRMKNASLAMNYGMAPAKLSQDLKSWKPFKV